MMGSLIVFFMCCGNFSLLHLVTCKSRREIALFGVGRWTQVVFSMLGVNVDVDAMQVCLGFQS